MRKEDMERIRNLLKNVGNLPESKQEYLLAFSEGMAVMASMLNIAQTLPPTKERTSHNT